MATLRGVARTLLLPAVLAIALLCFYLWLFNAWLGQGPPNPDPEWHRAWSVRFLIAGIVCSVVAIWLVVRRLRATR